MHLDKQDRWVIISSFVEFCEAARVFDWSDGDKSRRSDTAAIKDAETAARTARRLALFLRKHPHQYGFAVGSASLESRVFLRKTTDEHPVGSVSMFGVAEALHLAKLLQRLDQKLGGKNILAKAGPMLHRTRHGPLHYARPIDNQSKLPDRETCLAIYLVSKLRHFEASGNWPTVGYPVPRKGSARWALIAQWVQNALGTDSDVERKASKVIQNNPGLQIWNYF